MCYDKLMSNAAPTSCQWNQLLSPVRLSRVNSGKAASRSDFNRDYGRVLYSSAFRRMQDKTQVFPLGRNDYVRTRLTHSLEVSNVGRALGQSLAGMLLAQDTSIVSNPHSLIADMGELVATACLAHDLGNPPFGHSGEDAISASLQGTPYQGFIFEGNAQGFRLLTSTCDPMRNCGLDLTVASLAAFSKYPCIRAASDSARELQLQDNSLYVGCKKFGIYDSELDSFELVAKQVGLRPMQSLLPAWYRHPLSYLMEAADDISYLIADIEDACVSQVISYDEASAQLGMLVDDSAVDYCNKIRREEGDKSAIRAMRAIAVGCCIDAINHCMVDHLAELRDGNLSQSLIKMSTMGAAHAALEDFSFKSIYRHEQVVSVELAGYQVIKKLIDLFMEWVIDPTSTLGSMLESQLKPLKSGPEMEEKERFQCMLDYISEMTDSKSLQTYRSLFGIS